MSRAPHPGDRRGARRHGGRRLRARPRQGRGRRLADRHPGLRQQGPRPEDRFDPRVRHGSPRARPQRGHHDPLRRRLRPVDRRALRHDQRRSHERLVLLCERHRVAGRLDGLRPGGRRPDLVGLPGLDSRDAGPRGGGLLAGAVRARVPGKSMDAGGLLRGRRRALQRRRSGPEGVGREGGRTRRLGRDRRHRGRPLERDPPRSSPVAARERAGSQRRLRALRRRARSPCSNC